MSQHRRTRLRQRGVELEARTAELFGRLDGLRPAQLAFKPAPESWSILQVAQHLLLVEEAILKTARKGSGPRPPTLKDRLGHLIIRWVLRSGRRVKVPSRAIDPPADPISWPEMKARWRASRLELEAFLADRSNEELGNVLFRHPVAGPLDYPKGVGFIADHIAHHLRQIERVEKSPGFPTDEAG